VVASLAKKGLVVCSGRGQDATIEVTAAGAEAVRS
jgi:predicted MarR family transcription regulator